MAAELWVVAAKAVVNVVALRAEEMRAVAVAAVGSRVAVRVEVAVVDAMGQAGVRMVATVAAVEREVWMGVEAGAIPVMDWEASSAAFAAEAVATGVLGVREGLAVLRVVQAVLVGVVTVGMRVDTLEGQVERGGMRVDEVARGAPRVATVVQVAVAAAVQVAAEEGTTVGALAMVAMVA